MKLPIALNIGTAAAVFGLLTACGQTGPLYMPPPPARPPAPAPATTPAPVPAATTVPATPASSSTVHPQ